MPTRAAIFGGTLQSGCDKSYPRNSVRPYCCFSCCDVEKYRIILAEPLCAVNSRLTLPDTLGNIVSYLRDR